MAAMIQAKPMSRSRAFWSTSASWTSTRRAQIDRVRAAGMGGSDQITRKEARWAVSAERYLRARPDLVATFDGVRVDPALFEKVRELMEAVAPALTKAFDTHLAGLAFEAWRQWPVASGLSKSMLELAYEVSEGGDTFTGTVRSRAPYTVYIAGQPHREFIDRPSAQVADAIGTDAIDEIARMA